MVDPKVAATRIQELETARRALEKKQSLAERNRRRELADAKKKISRETSLADKLVRKSEQDINRLSQQASRWEGKVGQVKAKKHMQESQMHEKMSSFAGKRAATEAVINSKVAQLGEAKGRLAQCQFAAKLLERGVIIPAGLEGPLPTASPEGSAPRSPPMNSYRLESTEGDEQRDLVAEKMELAAENKMLRVLLSETEAKLKSLEEQRSHLEQSGVQGSAEFSPESRIPPSGISDTLDLASTAASSLLRTGPRGASSVSAAARAVAKTQQPRRLFSLDSHTRQRNTVGVTTLSPPLSAYRCVADENQWAPPKSVLAPAFRQGYWNPMPARQTSSPAMFGSATIPSAPWQFPPPTRYVTDGLSMASPRPVFHGPRPVEPLCKASQIPVQVPLTPLGVSRELHSARPAYTAMPATPAPSGQKHAGVPQVEIPQERTLSASGLGDQAASHGVCAWLKCE